MFAPVCTFGVKMQPKKIVVGDADHAMMHVIVVELEHMIENLYDNIDSVSRRLFYIEHNKERSRAIEKYYPHSSP